MSFRLPEIRLDKGEFTYEGETPVFIDHNGTRHYEIGKTQEQLLFLGMQLQRDLDIQELQKKDREVSLLKEESLEMQQLVERNFFRGRRFQANLDKIIVEDAKVRLYWQTQENQLLRQQIDYLRNRQQFLQSPVPSRFSSFSVPVLEEVAKEWEEIHS